MDKWQHHAEIETEPEPEAPRLDRTQILFAALASAAFCMALFAGVQWWQSGGAVEYRPVAPAQANPVIRKFPTPPTAAELVTRDDAAHKAWREAEQRAQALTVYAGARGSRYHTASCAALADGRTPMHLGDAQAQGYSPCAVCKPEGWAGYLPPQPATPPAVQPVPAAEPLPGFNALLGATTAVGQYIVDDTLNKTVTPMLPPPSPPRVPVPVPPAPPPMSQREQALRAAAEHEAAMDAEYSHRRNNTPVGTKTTVRPYWWRRLDGGVHTSN